MNKRNNLFSFYYPCQKGRWHWTWWFNVKGGFKNWLYHRWESTNKEKTNKWTGIIILGFKRIDKEWLISPEKALEEYNKGVKRFFMFIKKLSKETLDDVEETRLFK